MDLNDYRNSSSERLRIDDLMRLLPDQGGAALDIGARDGFLSIRLADRYQSVTALDLKLPTINHPKVTCVKGDITSLAFPVGAFNLVFCTEVLEHIPPQLLETACRELVRVSSEYLMIGVPYRQDIRVGRTTCIVCGKVSPPYGHLNSFDETKLSRLFPACSVLKESLIGTSSHRTNSVSTKLMDWAGNPYGTYGQEEPCGHCGAPFKPPGKRNLWKKILTRSAVIVESIQNVVPQQHANWIHVLFKKHAS